MQRVLNEFPCAQHFFHVSVIDFFRILPGISEAKVKSRIIMSPVHLKTLVRALQDNINKYENKFGEIKAPSPDASNPGFKLPEDVLPN